MHELAIPRVRQTERWSCGPASVTAVLRYYGHKGIGERAIIRRSGCNAEGSTIAGLMTAAQSYGVMTYSWQGVSYETLCRISELGNPVIAAIQAWHERPDDDWAGYADEWQDGHFVTVTHADDDGITFMDPSLPGARGYLDRDSWLERWHDLDVADKRILQAVIVFPAAVVRRRRVGRIREIG